MAQVTVTIDGKSYRMACEEGQEEHLTGLAQTFDQYVIHLKRQFGEIGDLRLTVMAGIMVMDELFEANRAKTALLQEVEGLRKTREGANAAAERNDAAVAGMISEIAQQVKEISAKLEGPREQA
ncbi:MULTISPECIES: cell division protein ZapA [unclassified Rhizobium]|uniref:cell division protein ZapA n=1 Tax=unclassified Rhizobium TaxID=2613769 RepID=UPI0016021AEB|nr:MULTISPECIES: cell division protein ZapA [unclassified Rhizobium]MBB1249881.1 cell division protein ZapA [Rhizobium sp. G21]MCV3765811.1 cell division protein ZapA [Rhizobium sp. TRM95796]